MRKVPRKLKYYCMEYYYIKNIVVTYIQYHIEIYPRRAYADYYIIYFFSYSILTLIYAYRDK